MIELIFGRESAVIVKLILYLLPLNLKSIKIRIDASGWGALI